MLRSGAIVGPRLFTVGTPMYGTRRFRPKTYRSFKNYDDVLEQVRFNKAHGATALKDYLTPSRQVRQQLAAAARAEGLNLVIEPGGDAQAGARRIGTVLREEAPHLLAELLVLGGVAEVQGGIPRRIGRLPQTAQSGCSISISSIDQ